MKNIKNNISALIGFLLIGIVITIWIIGAFHGAKKHEVKPFDEAFGFEECWYYGVEYFWHKPNYDELNENIKLGTMILLTDDSYFNYSKRLEFIQSKKGFKKILKKLDTDEVEYIKKGVTSYFNFLESIQKDFFNNLKSTNSFKFKESPATIEKGKECITYNLKKEIQEVRLGFQKIKTSSLNEYQTIKKDNYKILEQRAKNFFNSISKKRDLLFEL